MLKIRTFCEVQHHAFIADAILFPVVLIQIQRTFFAAVLHADACQAIDAAALLTVIDVKVLTACACQACRTLALRVAQVRPAFQRSASAW